jgi:hypothetical protein
VRKDHLWSPTVRDDDEDDDRPRRPKNRRNEPDDDDRPRRRLRDPDADDDDRTRQRRRDPDEDDERDEARPRRRPRDDDEDEDRPWQRGRQRRRRRDEDFESESEEGMEFVVPTNTSALAIVAGYVGLISVLCFPAPLALILGIVALVQLKNKPKVHGRYRAWFAVVMGTMFTLIPVVLFVIGSLGK